MSSFYLPTSTSRIILPTSLLLLSAIGAVGQSAPSSPPPANTPSPTAASTPGPSQPVQSVSAQTGGNSSVPVQPVVTSAIQVTPGDDTPQANPVLKRIERARALAAAHQLQQAATDLENVRASVNDITLRNVTTLMLIGIYLEEGNYGRAQALLEEGFLGRRSQRDESLRTYFAMAGQTVNGIRAHLARYRSFGINPSEPDLPAEANADLDRVRAVLERVVAQAKEISAEAGRSYDAVALLEDVVGIRLSISRNNDDHAKWQTEYVLIRERLASSQAQAHSIGRSALLDAVTAKIPNPFATKPSDASQTDSSQPESATRAASSSAAPAEIDRSTPQLISTGSLSGRESKRVTPEYPPLARSTGVIGTVRVFAIVDENGKVWVTNSEGPTLLRKAAEEAAKNWTFPPTLVGGKPARLAGYLDFDFKL